MTVKLGLLIPREKGGNGDIYNQKIINLETKFRNLTISGLIIL